MKITYAIGTNFAGPGTGNTLYRIASEANKAGYLQGVYCTSAEKTEIEAEKIKRLRTNIAPWFSWPGGPLYTFFINDNLFDLAVSLRLEKTDIFFGWVHNCLFSMRKAKKNNAVTFVYSANSYPVNQRRILAEEYKKFGFKWPLIDRFILKKMVKEFAETDFVQASSEFVYNSFIEHGIEREKLFLIPNGVDLKKFKPTEKTDDVFRVVFVGSLCLRKGIQYLLPAWKELSLRNAELALAGYVDADAKKIVEAYKQENSIKHLGFVSPANLPEKCYGSSSVFVLPSVEEGSALVSYEAMASGLPSVVSQNTGAVVRDGKDGFVIPIRSVREIKEKIQYFFDNPSEGKRMGRNARRHVENFSWETMGDKLNSAYRASLEAKR